MSDYTKLSDADLARALVAAGEDAVELLNEVRGRLDLPLDETEQGLTPWASRQVDDFVASTLAYEAREDEDR